MLYALEKDPVSNSEQKSVTRSPFLPREDEMGSPLSNGLVGTWMLPAGDPTGVGTRPKMREYRHFVRTTRTTLSTSLGIFTGGGWVGQGMAEFVICDFGMADFLIWDFSMAESLIWDFGVADFKSTHVSEIFLNTKNEQICFSKLHGLFCV